MFTPGDKLEFGHYTILRELGSGGMGVVYHCRDEFLQREIAIKMMLPELMSEPDTVEIFRQEARLAAQLEHPGIVTIHNIGVENREGNTHHYIAMEFLPGGSLRGRIGKEPVQIEQAVEWMKQLATALNYAHKRGVVHQDIKPDNIFITHDGNLKIGDFGLALIATGPAFERHAQGKGTPAYMSPELCRGEPRDHRSDIYSLGAVFYEMLTGEKPYKADGMIEMALKHATAPIPQASKLRPDIPPLLDKALKVMLTKMPEDRLQSLNDLLPSLEKLLLEIKVARLGISQPSPGLDGKKGDDNKQPGEQSIDFSPAEAEKRKESAATAAASAREAKEAAATAAQEANAVINDNPNLSAEKEKSIELLWTFKTFGPIGWSATPVLNRTRKEIYVPSADGIMYALDMNTGACNWHYSAGSPLVSSVLQLNSEIYFTASDGTIHCVSAESGKKLWIHEGSSPAVSTPVTAGDAILVTALDGGVKSLNSKDGAVNWTYRCDKGVVASPQIVEKAAFVASKDKGLHAIDLNSGSRKWFAESTDAMLASVLASTDSVYCASIDGNIMAVDISSGSKTWSYKSSYSFLCKGNLEFTSLNYCTKDGFVHSLDKYKGNLLWRTKASGPVLGGITSSSGALYVSSRNGVLHCYNAKTGELNWYLSFPCALESAPLVSSTVIYQGTVTGEVQALSAPAKAK